MNRNSNRNLVNKNLEGISAKMITQRLGLPDMCYVQHLHDLIEVLDKHNISEDSSFVSECFIKLIDIREQIFEYSKHSTSVEYERCIPNLIRKLDSKISAAISNGERYKVLEFIRGNLHMDDIDKKNISPRTEHTQDIENSYEICMLCSNQQVIVKDGYKHCLRCSGIYR